MLGGLLWYSLYLYILYLNGMQLEYYFQHEVVGCGNENIIKLLLANGANPNIPGGQNDTPLHDAVACNRPAIVRLLVSHGADVNARNSRGLTPK